MSKYGPENRIVMTETELDTRPIRRTKTEEYKASDLVQKINAACRELRVKIPDGWKTQIAGSIRRRNLIVHDLDIVVCIMNPAVAEDVQKYFSEFKEENDFHTDIRYCTRSNYGSTILYLTGNAEHNIQMRIIASDMGLILNEYGLFTRGEDTYLVGKTEKSIYKRLDLCYIPPGRRNFIRQSRFRRQSELEIEK